MTFFQKSEGSKYLAIGMLGTNITRKYGNICSLSLRSRLFA
jgi:hypothetical protein